MTNENTERDAPKQGYLICKNGLFYRPNSCGYTSAKSEAGRYSLKDAIAITHPNGPEGPRDGMTYTHESEVPDPRANLSDAQAARIAELEAERDETMREALSLARVLHKTHYSDVTQWEPLDYPAGIISQIDNMVAGIVARAEAAEAKLAKTVSVLEHIAHASDFYGVEANAEDQGADTLAYAHKSTCNLARATLADLADTTATRG